MTNLIYQYWDGDVPPGCKTSSALMQQYATRIGADYLFEHNPQYITGLGKYSPHYGSFKPVFEKEFFHYDNILFCDSDIYPVDGLTESIFDGFDYDLGICTEPLQPTNRQKLRGHHISTVNDERWAKLIESTWNVTVPRNEQGLIKIYNSGVVLWSKKGAEKARQNLVPFQEYIAKINHAKLPGFYTSDQCYLHAMLEVAKFNYLELDKGWNSFVHYYFDRLEHKGRPQFYKLNDERTSDTKLVHIQLSGADNWDDKTLWRITNLPTEQWDL
jgi:hypothetical protein